MELSAVRRMSSSFVGQLIWLEREMKSQGRRFILCAARDNIMEMFKLTGLDNVLTIVDDEYMALSEAASD